MEFPDVSKVTKLPPKTLAIVVAGGIGAGLLWRRFHKSSSGSGSGTMPGGSGLDTSQLALAGSSTGNLAASGSGTSDSSYIPQPSVKWVTADTDGNLYLTDASGTLEPLHSGAANPTSTVPGDAPPPTPTPVPSPLATVNAPATATAPAVRNAANILSGAYPSTPDEYKWAQAIQQIMDRDHISEAQANTNLSRLLTGH